MLVRFGIFVLVSFFLNFAQASHSTNGGVLRADNNNVWFLGDEPVEFCIEGSPAFPYNRRQVTELVYKSIQEWREFFHKYGLDRLAFSGLKNDRSLGLALNFKEVPTCTRPDQQIRFIFGSVTPEVADALKYQDRALALAVRGPYNHDTYRTGGQVWVRNFNHKAHHLKHLILHELGHVFGMEHDSVHVMDDRSLERMIKGPQYDFSFGTIETSVWPYRYEPGDLVRFTESGRLAGKYESNNILDPIGEYLGFTEGGHHALVMEKAADMNPNGPVPVRLLFEEAESGRRIQMRGEFEQDDVPMRNMSGVRGPVFYTVWHCHTCGSGKEGTRYLDSMPSGGNLSGTFVFNGQKLPAIIELKKGFQLRVHFPEQNVWFSTEFYRTSYRE